MKRFRGRQGGSSRRKASPRFFASLALCIAGQGACGLALDAPPDVELYLGGSSAQDELLEGLMRLRPGLLDAPNICVEGSLDIYSSRVQGARQRLFFCETDRFVEDVPAGLRLAVYKSSGGSGEGVQPLLTGTPLPFLAVAGLVDGDCRAQTRVLPTGDLAAYTEHRDCSGRVVSRFLHAGISDLEPALLATDTSSLVTRSLAQLVWGLPVSKNLRNALQAIQGLVPADVPHDDPARETPEVMPSLSSTQISSIFAGSVAEWSAFYDGAGEPVHRSSRLARAAPDLTNLSGTAPGAYQPDAVHGNSIYLCRRIETSGTQIAFGTHYLRQRCTSDAHPFAVPNDGSDLERGGNPRELLDQAKPPGRVFAGVGSSDVEACLDIHDDRNRWAIGMLSTENPGNNVSREYRHIRIDGYAPTLLNAHNGRWRHVSSASMQWLPDEQSSGTRRETVAVRDFIANHMAQPAVLRSLNRKFRYPWGQGGYLADSRAVRTGPEAMVTAESLATFPVAGVSSSRRGEPQNCQVPLLRGASSILLR